MRASNSFERGEWLVAIMRAVAESQCSAEILSQSVAAHHGPNVHVRQPTNQRNTPPARRSVNSARFHATPASISATKIQTKDSSRSGSPFIERHQRSISVASAHPSTQEPSMHSIQQIIRQNMPNAIQFFVVIGQIIAAAR
ncbi:unnamed protein product [Phytophthora lilii]|uniref:Unnamed protein product n=1 Tax=Phytophthora lilii TaxID=2077276 RepID=A0A9W6TTH5_9STRA|nr:unnamed protein product [Phytophthora lilii]